MSSGADAAAAATVALYNRLYAERCCSVATVVVFIYDALILLGREVACFWTARQTGASLLFFANKWLSITVYVLGLADFTFTFSSDLSCTAFIKAKEASLALQFIPGAAFSALRAYVLSRSKPLGLLVFALSLAPLGVNLAIYGFQVSGVNIPPFGCLGEENTTAALNIRSACNDMHGARSSPRTCTVVLISRIPLIAADVLLIYITWAKLSTPADIRPSKRLPLQHTLFHGGIIYFVIMFIMNVLHVVLTATAVAGNGYQSLVPEFTAPITAILILRFLLGLQEANRAVVRLDPDDPLHSSRNSYDSAPSFISSLGGFVNPALSAHSDDDVHVSQVRSRSVTEG